MKSLRFSQIFLATVGMFGAVNLTAMLPTVAQNSPSTPDSQLPPVSPTSPNSPTTPNSTPKTPNTSTPTNSNRYPSSTTPTTQTRPTNSQYPNSTQYPNSRPNSTQYPNSTQPNSTQYPNSRPNSTQYPNSTQPNSTQYPNSRPNSTKPNSTQYPNSRPNSTQPNSTQPDSRYPNSTTPNNPTRPPNSTTPNSSMRSSADSSSLTTVDRQFAMKAAQSDMTEIKTSQLALKRSQNPQILSYAREMIQAHTDSTAKLKPIAARLGLTMPKSLGAENQSFVNSLTGLSSTQFDRAYTDGQAKAHAKTQATFQTELNQGQNSQLKAFANEILPVVSMHLEMAKNLTAMR